MTVKIKNRLVIKQSDKLSFAKYSLSLLEAKFLALVIAQIDKDDDEFKEYAISIKDFSKVTGSKIDYSDMLDFSKNFISKTVTIQDDKNKKFTVFNWWHHLRYQDGILYAQIHDYMRPFLLKFNSHFGKSSLLTIAQFKSKYAPRLYYMICSYKAQYKNSFDIDLEELYDILEASKTQIANYGEFKRKVLQPALKEINEISDINLKVFEQDKKRKKVISLRFEFTNKDKNLLDFS